MTCLVGSARLTIEQVLAVAHENLSVGWNESARTQVLNGREKMNELLSKTQRPLYGINTGFGSLKNVRIETKDIRALQSNLIRSHAAGVGALLSVPCVRAMMLIRAHTLARAHSAVRPEVIDELLWMLNEGITPVVPAQGSVGASGDLAPLAHLALALVGEGRVICDGEVKDTADVYKRFGRKPLDPQAKEALALLNGTQMMTSTAVLSLNRTENLLRHADIACALSLEATLGSGRAFDVRVHALRSHAGQGTVARNVSKLLAGSQIGASHVDCERVQDAYSIRCAPQVHGATRDAASFVRSVLETEINSVTDNPLFFPDEGEFISAGNFHGQPVAAATDFLALSLTSLGSISERRTFRLLDPKLSELPAGLITDAGLHSGLMMLQVTAAALVSENKTLAHPASVDSIPTWADQEDHVSMGPWSARKLETIVSNTEIVLAIELLCAAQALEFRRPLRSSEALEAVHAHFRKCVSRVDADRVLSGDVDRVRNLVAEGSLLREAEKLLGALE